MISKINNQFEKNIQTCILSLIYSKYIKDHF